MNKKIIAVIVILVLLFLYFAYFLIFGPGQIQNRIDSYKETKLTARSIVINFDNLKYYCKDTSDDIEDMEDEEKIEELNETVDNIKDKTTLLANKILDTKKKMSLFALWKKYNIDAHYGKARVQIKKAHEEFKKDGFRSAKKDNFCSLMTEAAKHLDEIDTIMMMASGKEIQRQRFFSKMKNQKIKENNIDYENEYEDEDEYE